jgi:hypothetical protein
MEIKLTLIILFNTYVALFLGYWFGNNHGMKEARRRAEEYLNKYSAVIPKKDEPLHEDDPWDKLRIDIPDKEPVIQTLAEEERS